MVKFAYIKEVELEDPSKCGGCIFQDFAESGASMGSSYCNATEEGFLINTPGRPDWCPLVLNYKEALHTACTMLDEVLEGAPARKEVIDFSKLIGKELGRDEPEWCAYI